MFKPHKFMFPVCSSRFFLTIFLVILVVAVVRVPALEGENNSDIVVTFSSSSHKEAIPRDFAGTSTDGVKFTVEPSSITVDVSTTFNIEIWLRDIPQPLDGYTVVIFVFGLVELIDTYEENVIFPITDDVKLGTIRLHCLGVDSIIVDIDDIQSGVFIDTDFIPASGDDGIIHQIGPIGGITIQTNKLEILTPYISIAGFIVVLSTVYIIKRRKD